MLSQNTQTLYIEFLQLSLQCSRQEQWHGLALQRSHDRCRHNSVTTGESGEECMWKNLETVPGSAWQAILTGVNPAPEASTHAFHHHNLVAGPTSYRCPDLQLTPWTKPDISEGQMTAADDTPTKSPFLVTPGHGLSVLTIHLTVTL